jgi:Flp pilus assembly protein TadD
VKHLISRVALVALLFAPMTACGGGTPPPDAGDNPPPFDDEDSGAPSVAASSAKVQEGKDAIEAGDFQKAKEILTAAVAEAPKDPQAAFYLGVALANSNDAAGAKENYKKALELDPKLTDASVNLSALLLDEGDGAGALEVVKKAIPVAPQHPDLLMNHALALEATGDKAGALNAYAVAVKYQPKNLELHYAFAENLADAGKDKEATAVLKKVAGSSDMKLLLATANLFGKVKAFSDCVATLDKVMQKQASPDAHTRRGVCRHELKDEEGAAKDYEEAIKIDAKYAPAHYYLGMHYKAAGKKKEAKAAFGKAVEFGGEKGVGAAAKKALEELK